MYEHLFDEQLCLMIPAGHPLLRAKRLTPHELVKYPLILPPKGGADRKALERVLGKHNLVNQIKPALVCALIDVARHYVELGVGIAVMYLSEKSARDTPKLHVRPLSAEIERLPIEMVVRKGTHLPDYVEDFRKIVRLALSTSTANNK